MFWMSSLRSVRESLALINNAAAHPLPIGGNAAMISEFILNFCDHCRVGGG